MIRMIFTGCLYTLWITAFWNHLFSNVFYNEYDRKRQLHNQTQLTTYLQHGSVVRITIPRTHKKYLPNLLFDSYSHCWTNGTKREAEMIYNVLLARVIDEHDVFHWLEGAEWHSRTVTAPHQTHCWILLLFVLDLVQYVHNSKLCAMNTWAIDTDGIGLELFKTCLNVELNQGKSKPSEGQWQWCSNQ